MRAEIQLLDSQPTQVRLVWQADPEQLAGGEGQTCWVGLPQTGEPRLEVVGALPAGALRVEPGGEEWTRVPGPARLSEVGYVRDQRVVGVVFGPQPLGADRLGLYGQVEVVVHFGASGVSSSVHPDRWGEELYQSLLVNYQQSRGWRRRPERRIAKPVQELGGAVFRVRMRESGVYRLTGQDLVESGVSLEGLDPARISLWYGGGRALPTRQPFDITLAELAIAVEDGGDGRFDPEDYLLFYGEGLERWEYQHNSGLYLYRRNLYTRDNVYWLVLGGAVGKRVQVRSGALQERDPQRPGSYRVRVHEESEERILRQLKGINSGYDWYWQEFSGNARNFPVAVQGAAEGPVQILLGFFGNKGGLHPFTVQAEGVVDKLIDYDRTPEIGPWQTRVLLVADDLSNPSQPQDIERYFVQDSERLARENLPEDLDLVKLYIGQYPLEGRTKPRARDEFIRRFNEGALLLTFLGHGNPEVLAHEQIFLVSRDLAALDNGRRLPFMYTAASQVGVFDDPARESMPEILLDLPEGGVIGMISATRIGYHGSNFALAREFHSQMFRSGREHVPVGLALMEGKQLVVVDNSDTGRRNVQRYSLFGDVGTRLARPRYAVDLEVPDTLKALQEVQLSGQIRDPEGRAAGDFNGQVWVQAFDSAGPSEVEGMTFVKEGAPLFRGLFQVELGRFETLFRVPKDISYQGQEGRISAYAWSPSKPSAFGAARQRVMAGTAVGVVPDEEGPQISIGFQGRPGFKNGDQVPPRLMLEVALHDESGINVTGETGHEIELK
ncbi:MAG: hypothetical protein HYW07_09335 [Candidatus Latescibacteria bacterium]|nr:hypothetical protein [Candidatus Latescibacterota bacterium]